MIWATTWQGVLAITTVVSILVLIVHGPEIRRERRMAAERRAREAGQDAPPRADQPKKTSASA